MGRDGRGARHATLVAANKVGARHPSRVLWRPCGVPGTEQEAYEYLRENTPQRGAGSAFVPERPLSGAAHPAKVPTGLPREARCGLLLRLRGRPPACHRRGRSPCNQPTRDHADGATLGRWDAKASHRPRRPGPRARKRKQTWEAGRVTLTTMKAAIFDMDGLIIDSEPLWRLAERAAFARVGLELSDDDCRRTTGLRSDEVVGYWFARHPWTGSSQEEVVLDLEIRVADLISARGAPCLESTMPSKRLRESGLRLALASSSSHELIRVVLAALGMEDTFEVLSSGADELRGKPDPAVYLTTVRRLGLPAMECLAFEDSAAGVRAAHAAGCRVIAVPAAADFDDPRFDIADLKLRSLGFRSPDRRAFLTQRTMVGGKRVVVGRPFCTATHMKPPRRQEREGVARFFSGSSQGTSDPQEPRGRVSRATLRGILAIFASLRVLLCLRSQ